MPLYPISIALGSNLGDRLDNLSLAVRVLTERVFTKIPLISSIYESRALLPRSGPLVSWNRPFLNMCVHGYTWLSFEAIFQEIFQVETTVGRGKRKFNQAWSPRLIDIDLIYYGSLVRSTKVVCIPHKECHNRPFVMKPLAEINPFGTHPRLGLTNTGILARLSSCADHFLCREKYSLSS